MDWEPVLQTVGGGLLLAGLIALLRMWGIQGVVAERLSTVTKRVTDLEKAQQNGLQEARDLRASISDLLGIAREHTAQMKQHEKDLDRAQMERDRLAKQVVTGRP